MQLAAVMMTVVFVASALISRGRALPTMFLSGAWAIVYLLQSLFASDMYSSTLATVLVTTISAAFAMGELVTLNAAPALVPPPEWPRASPRAEFRLRNAVVLSAVISVAGAYVYARALGLFDTDSLVETLLTIGATRERIFSGDIQLDYVSRFGMLIGYSSVVLSVAYWYLFNWRWWLLVPSLAVFAMGAAQAGRAGTLIILLQWVTAVLLKVKCARYRPPRTLIVLPAIMAVVFVGGQLYRTGFSDTSASGLFEVVASLRGYLFGGVSGFAYYVDQLMPSASLSFGKYSFSSLFAALGIAEQDPGVYDQYVPIGSPDAVTNLFSAYRSFLDDFGVGGAVVAAFLAGMIVAAVFTRFSRGKLHWVGTVIPALSALAFAPMYSLTYFTSFLASLFVPTLVCKWALAGGPGTDAEPGLGEETSSS